MDAMARFQWCTRRVGVFVLPGEDFHVKVFNC